MPLTTKGLMDAPGATELAKVHSSSETSWRRLLWYILAGSRGGVNRGRIINLLRNEPHNVNQLAQSLDVHYRVAEHHIRALEKNNLIAPSGESYGRLYFLSSEMEAHLPLFDEIWKKIEPSTREVKK